MTTRGPIRQIADLLGVDPKSVRNALATAGIPLDLGGRSVEEIAKIVEAIVDPARVSGHAVTRAGRNGSGELSDARAQYERLRARRLEIENAETEGKLVDRDAVIESLRVIVGEARTAYMALGVRCAPKLVGLEDQKEIVRIIEAETRDVLDGLANDMAFFERMDAETLS